MFMDPSIREQLAMINGFKLEDQLGSQNSIDDFRLQTSRNYIVYDRNMRLPPGGVGSPPSTASGDETLVLSEIHSDIALSFISQILMEEDMEDKIYMHEGDPALLAAEKPFYDILKQNSPTSPDRPPLYCDGSGSPCDSASGHFSNSNSGYGGSKAVDNSWITDFGEYPYSQIQSASVDYNSQSSFSSLTNGIDVADESSVPSLLFGSLPVLQFNKGVEEASRFLPDSSKLVIDLESNCTLLPQKPKHEVGKLLSVKTEEEEEQRIGNESRVRKNLHHDDLDLEEGKSIKQSAVYSGETDTGLFDSVLLMQCDAADRCRDGSTIKEVVQSSASKSVKNGTTKGSTGGKSKGKKQVKKEVVDLRTLLIQCAQSIAADDRRSANEQLKQIRQHASSSGDGSQRLAHYFADGLEARLAGIGSQIYRSFMAKRTTSAANILKAYQLYMGACPFKKLSHFFANQTILNVCDNKSRVHIIDFGISFGFQWPCLIQRLSMRSGGSPKLRITGIDFPQPGFRPTERLEDTGRRLTEYAKRFGVPFEYQMIASKWENIQIEDLNLDKDDVLIVNCLNMLKNLADETVVVESPRNIVLNNIRRMNPDVFIHGVLNGSYSAPFFVTRFREALFHFSALYDMLECNVPRDDPQRLLIEKEFFAQEAMNVIACEGLERVQRPETYKQWQVRNQRAGFTQLPLDPLVLENSRAKVSKYNKDFVVDEDGKWMLQGWKGRIIYALSTWKPTKSGI